MRYSTRTNSDSDRTDQARTIHFVYIEALRLIRRTARAIYIQIDMKDDPPREILFPLSQISVYAHGNPAKLYVKMKPWLAIDRDIVESKLHKRRPWSQESPPVSIIVEGLFYPGSVKYLEIDPYADL